ncbi:MAG: ImmA/IrrE family metallo-endopeptidase [Clostridia bacterium]|nr:ImmA/IrrE family metallo-endopeptidase [Clostridia bacterium]
MERKIRRAAIKFNRSLHGRPDSKNIIAALKKNGYEVVFYNTTDGDAALKAYNLQSLASARNAFTISDAVKIVFVNNNLSASDKRDALLHESGHILLGHIGNGISHLLDNRINEAEADSFMLEVIHPTRTSPLTIMLAVLLLISILVGYALYKKTTSPVTFIPAQSSEEMVYITSSGSKYHTEGCIHTKDKDCARIARAQADIIKNPCSVCNP